jgi:hypothetical protein
VKQLVVVPAAAAAALAAGAGHAAVAFSPPRASPTLGCRAADPKAPIRAFDLGGRNLTIAIFTLSGLEHLADPAGFRRFRRGGAYRIPTYAVVGGGRDLRPVPRHGHGLRWLRRRPEAGLLHVRGAAE